MEQKSKTKKKKEAEALQEIGEQLVELPAEQLKGIDLPIEIYNAVNLAKKLKRGALRRQMQYIGTLMRKYDPEPVKEALRQIELGNFKKAAEFKETEKLRDELVLGNTALMEEILKQCHEPDRRQLAQLIRQAGKESVNNKPPKASHALFRYLKKIGVVQFNL